MKFACLSSALLLAAAATQVQAHKMRGVGRSLEEFDGLSLSLSMPAAEDLALAKFDTPKSASDEQQQEAGLNGFAPSSKSSKTTTGVCDNRLELLQEALEEKTISLTEEQINEKCHYQPQGIWPTLPFGPNFGCALGYYPPGTPDGKWSDGKKKFWTGPPLAVGGKNANIYVALEMYCECHLGIDEGCAAKVPRQGDDLAFHGDQKTVEKWVDYCKFAGIWNGDFSIDDNIVLTNEVEKCCCYFIGVAKDKLDSCPGVNLGEFFG
jgi:hypothetical protein